MIKVGDYEADFHSFHHPSLNTDLSVIRNQSAKKDGPVIVHHHRSEDPCDGREHEAYNTIHFQSK